MVKRRRIAYWLLCGIGAAYMLAQGPGLPAWQVIKDKAGYVRLQVTNTLDRPITAVLIYDTVSQVADGKVVRTGYYLYDNTAGWSFSLKPGETYETPDPVADMSLSPRTDVPNRTFQHKFELVAIATEAPDVRGDPRHANLIRQRRNARHKLTAEYASIIRDPESHAAGTSGLIARLEQLQQRLLARAANSEEKSLFSVGMQLRISAIQGYQKQLGGERLPDQFLAGMLNKAENARQAAARAAIP